MASVWQAYGRSARCGRISGNTRRHARRVDGKLPARRKRYVRQT
jgi:hypothetical protein